jgi:hypothetical protein
VTAATVASAGVTGMALGIAFNPIASLIGAPVAAGLTGYPRAPRSRLAWAGAFLLLAWMLGDGFRVMARVRDAVDIGVPVHSGAMVPYTMLGVWAIAGLLLGYVLPAVLGAYVGRCVVRGTGWLSAIAVAAMFSGVLAALGAPVSAALARLVGG